MNCVQKCLSNRYKEIIEKELNVSPIQNVYSKNTSRNIFSLFEEENERLIVPKFWTHEDISNEDFETISKEMPLNKMMTQFTGSLREYQVEIVEDIQTILRENFGAILSLPCGFGKTVVAINLITKFQLKTLVIVHKSFLLNQWRENLEKFSNARVGVIQQKTVDTENKDVVIGMLQSLSKSNYPKDIFEQFDFVIVDEVHNIATKSFSKALKKFRSNYSLGLSATPERKDGLSKVFKWFLGDIVYAKQTDTKVEVELWNVPYKNLVESEKPLFQNLTLKFSGNLNISSMITNLSQAQTRNDLICDKISQVLRNRERNLLVLSSRISQLEYILSKSKNSDPGVQASLYIGKMKKEELKEAEKCRLLLATYQMVSEGFDLPKLNCILFATPRTDIEQSVGRILRNVRADIKPLIIDICDYDLQVFISQNRKRVKFYRKKFSVKTNFCNDF